MQERNFGDHSQILGTDYEPISGETITSLLERTLGGRWLGPPTDYLVLKYTAEETQRRQTHTSL